MKHAIGTTLKVTGCLALLGAGAALIAGKGDLRRFRRMRSM